jgi:hypothetical protein
VLVCKYAGNTVKLRGHPKDPGHTCALEMARSRYSAGYEAAQAAEMDNPQPSPKGPVPKDAVHRLKVGGGPDTAAS